MSKHSNRCECGRIKTAGDEACRRCARIEGSFERQEVVGRREQPIDYHHFATQAAVTRFFRVRGINEADIDIND